VIGARDAGADVIAEAREVGRLLALRKATLVTGGLGGVMEAASRGAHEAGGRTVGILPGEDRSGASPYVDVAIATGMGIGRNILIIRTADAAIAVGGAHGTLSEIAFALQMGKPVAGIGSWDIEGVTRATDAAEAVAAVFRELGDE